MTRQCAIAELKPGEAGGLELRGGALQLWKSRDFETVLAGPAETGKTYACCQYLDSLLWAHDGAQAVMVRKTYNSLVGSVLRTYLRVLGSETLVKTFGGERPQWFDYPNGSRLWLAGFDNPGKALSSERDFAYVNQAEELTLEDWEVLGTRCTGRGAVAPYTRVFADCNPGPPTHWIIQRRKENGGPLRFLESRHEDNPVLFDERSAITAQGRKTLGILDDLTGIRKDRLRFGKWVQAEGVVYEAWDRTIHLIDRFDVPVHWKRYWSVDFGYTNPFSWGLWAQDGDGRLFLVRQIYMTQRLVEDHARDMLRIAWNEVPVSMQRALTPGDLGRCRPQAVICDHDAEDRATLERHLQLPTVPAQKNVSLGIQAVQSRLKPAGDGKSRLYAMRDSLDERDSSLAEKRKPTCGEDEFEGYIWKPQTKAGSDMRNIPDEPIGRDDHFMDQMRYMVAHFESWGAAPFGDQYKGIKPPSSPYRQQEQRQAEGGGQRARGYYGRATEDDDDE